MPLVVNFNNKQIVEPGSYSTIRGLGAVPPVTGTYGTVLIIDTGLGKEYGYGSGITGELAQNSQSIYEFSSAEDCKKAFGGGLLWDLMDYLWSPSRNGRGISKLQYARAATTAAAVKTIAFSTGSITVKAKSEGIRGNGAVTVSTLTRGYSMKLKAGTIDSTKFILQFYEGQYRGADSSGTEYEMAESLVKERLITQSPEILNVTQLIAWMNTDSIFNEYFVLSASTASATSLVLADITSFSSHQLFAGGTETYSTTAMDAVLSSIEDLDSSMILSLDYGITPSLSGPQIAAGANKGALSTFNDKILAYVNNTSTYTDKLIWIGGGQNSSQYDITSGASDGSLQLCAYFNSDSVAVVHSQVKVPSSFNTALPYKFVDSLYHAALWCGRTAGLEPQTSPTYKDVRIIGVKHELKKSQREQALLVGLFHVRFVSNMGYVCNQAVTTLNPNSALVYPNGSTPEISIKRIKHQLNKELIINATPRYVGGNLNTASAAEIKAFTEGYLLSRIAQPLSDNLIIRYENVKVELQGTDWHISYCFVPNSPINRLFFTGFVIDPNINI